MEALHSQIRGLIKRGSFLLEENPKKLDYMAIEQKIKEKYSEKLPEHAQSQINILKADHKARSRDILNKYNEWFENSLQAMNSIDQTYVSQLKATKTILGVDGRVKAALEVMQRGLETLNIASKTEPLTKTQNESVANRQKQLINIIETGESEALEFKSSLLWDLKALQKNKKLELAAVKSISAFLNSEGGQLLIGVNDDKDIIGLEKDYRLMRKQNADGFIQYLLQIINFRLGKEFNKYINIRVEPLEGNEICIVDVNKSSNPVFMKFDNEEVFFIRASLSSQPLNVREATDYIRMHFS